MQIMFLTTKLEGVHLRQCPKPWSTCMLQKSPAAVHPPNEPSNSLFLKGCILSPRQKINTSKFSGVDDTERHGRDQ